MYSRVVSGGRQAVLGAARSGRSGEPRGRQEEPLYEVCYYTDGRVEIREVDNPDGRIVTSTPVDVSA
jgi:hypothetical protein